MSKTCAVVTPSQQTTHLDCPPHRRARAARCIRGHQDLVPCVVPFLAETKSDRPPLIERVGGPEYIQALETSPLPDSNTAHSIMAWETGIDEHPKGFAVMASPAEAEKRSARSRCTAAAEATGSSRSRGSTWPARSVGRGSTERAARTTWGLCKNRSLLIRHPEQSEDKRVASRSG